MSPSPNKPSEQALTGAMFRAINRVQAIIVFDLNGVVLEANPRYLELTGYTIDEIRGQHHRIFCDPDYAASEAYRQFWRKLAQGELHADEFRRYGKEGRVLWLQASYNPVYDEQGRLICIVKFATDITDRKLANAEFEGMMRAVDRVQAVIEFDLSGRVLRANDNFLALFGYQAAEIVGRHHRMFCSPEQVTQPGYAQLWQRLGRGEFDRGEYLRVGKNGRRVWIQASYNPIFDADGKPCRIVKFATDVSDRKRDELVLLKTQQALAMSNEVARIGTWEYDTSSGQAQLSTTTRELLGLTPADPPHDALRRLIDTHAELKQAMLAATRTGQSWDLELQIRNFRLEPLWVRFIGHVEFHVGHPVRIHGTMQDIQQQKLREAELSRARELAEAASRSKDKFLAMMSHELHTPMNAILGLGGLLQASDNLNAEQQDNVREIMSAGRHLLDLINDVLDLARITANNLELDLEPVCIKDLVAECCQMVRIGVHKHMLKLERSDIGHQVVHANRTRLKQVLLNLLSNAIKYNSQHGRIAIDCQHASPGRLRLAITNTGIGIPPEKHAELFHPFKRLGAEQTAIEGSGIGLSIAKQLIEKMKGRIGFTSTPGVETTFWIELPLSQEPYDHAGLDEHLPEEFPSVATAATAIASPAAAALPATPRDAGDCLILVAEDNVVNRKVIQRQLGMLGYRCETVENGELALRSWREGRFDLLLTDLQMPLLDGYALAEAIRAEEGQERHMPVIALTANVFDWSRETWKNKGMDDYLVKPTSIEDLNAKLQHWLQKAGPAQRSGRSAAVDVGPAQAPGMPRFDPSPLIELTGGDRLLLSELLLDYLNTTAQASQEIQQHAAVSAWGQVASTAHQTKSASRAVGANELGEICAALEASAKASRSPESSRHVLEFEQAWSELRPLIEHYLQAVTPTDN